MESSARKASAAQSISNNMISKMSMKQDLEELDDMMEESCNDLYGMDMGNSM